MIEKLSHFVNQQHDFTGILVILVLSVVITLIINFCLKLVLWQVFKKTGKEEFRLTRKNFRTPVFLFVLLILLYIFIPVVELQEQTKAHIYHALNIWLIAALGWTAINAVHFISKFILLRYDVKASDNLKARKVSTQLRVFERILYTLIIIVALATVLMTFDEIKKLGINLLASAGVAGIIIGLAAQKSIANIFAGIQIALTQPIRLDDVVIVENEWGWIEEINLTYVVVKIWDERRLIVPIHYFIDNPFQNWTRNTAQLLGTVFIYTDYKVPFNDLRNALTDILNHTPLWDKRVNVLQVTDAKENTLEIRALVSAKDSPTAWDLRVHVREKLIEYLQQNHPESLPRTRIEIKGTKTVV
jgi:small-conductance mechanosensitive channel